MTRSLIFSLGSNTCFGGSIGDEFQRPEQAAAAHVTDMAVVAEAFDQAVSRRAPMARTLSSRLSSRMMRCTSNAAAQATGCAW